MQRRTTKLCSFCSDMLAVLMGVTQPCQNGRIVHQGRQRQEAAVVGMGTGGVAAEGLRHRKDGRQQTTCKHPGNKCVFVWFECVWLVSQMGGGAKGRVVVRQGIIGPNRILKPRNARSQTENHIFGEEKNTFARNGTIQGCWSHNITARTERGL